MATTLSFYQAKFAWLIQLIIFSGFFLLKDPLNTTSPIRFSTSNHSPQEQLSLPFPFLIFPYSLSLNFLVKFVQEKETCKMEATGPPVVAAKRLWHIVRAVFFMLRKGISKRKLMMDLHVMLKRGKIAGKAIGNLMTFHHHSNFSCRSQDPHLAFFAPREYEFSCDNSPAFPFHFSAGGMGKRANNRHHHRGSTNKHSAEAEEDILVASALQKTLEMLNHPSAAASPVPSLWPSRPVRQLRITDSPFPIKNGPEEDSHVDDEAEEFISRFYEQLRQQKKIAALEASYYDNL